MHKILTVIWTILSAKMKHASVWLVTRHSKTESALKVVEYNMIEKNKASIYLFVLKILS